MTFKLYRVSLVILIICLLNSCGFHLREQKTLPPQLHKLIISPNQPWDRFQLLLKRQLASAGASFSQHHSASTLKLTRVYLSESTVAFGPDGQVHRARLDYTVHFSVENSKNEVILPNQTILIRRDYRINSNSKLSSDDEKAIIIEEMQRDAVDQVIQRLTQLE